LVVVELGFNVYLKIVLEAKLWLTEFHLR